MTIFGRWVVLAACALTAVRTFAGEAITYYHNDFVGSPVTATDQAGYVRWRAAYRPYGDRDQTTNEQLAAADNKRWFTGHVHDEETGLTYAGARFYDPMYGRFLSVDPVGFVEGNEQSFGRYAYANNNPYKFVDPDGREPTRSQAVTWAQARTVIQNFSGAPTLDGLRYTDAVTLGGKQIGPFGGDQGPRYVWTTGFGWIDLGHFFSAASGAKGRTGDSALNRFVGRRLWTGVVIGLAYETAAFENQQTGPTSWSYEDGPSNLAGVTFYFKGYSGDTTLLDDLDEFFNSVGAADPSSAPNWSQMQKTEDANKRYFQQNRSLSPVLNPQPAK
jgi:RHS repeat-associated protein